VKGSWQLEELVGAQVPQVVGRLFSAKLLHVERMVQTLGDMVPQLGHPDQGAR
jgi:hypothetical protein